MRNGIGVYVLPAGQPVVQGTVISETVFNLLTSDLANSLTQSLSADGQTTITANIPLNGFKLTGLGPATLFSDAFRFDQFVPLLRTSIIGAVGQLAGVPTGAIIERGSNANGEYTRFADGTLICTMTFPNLVAVPINVAVLAAAKSYPSAFTVIPAVSMSCLPTASNDQYGVISSNANLGGVQPVIRNGGSLAQDFGGICAIAIGRWF